MLCAGWGVFERVRAAGRRAQAPAEKRAEKRAENAGAIVGYRVRAAPATARAAAADPFPARTESMSQDFSTCDLCDAHKNDSEGDFRVLPPVFASFGGRARFAGAVATVKCHEDNTLVKAALDTPGQGRVLVVDGGASLRRALVGGNLAAAAARNGWAGIVVDGAVRDAAELAAAAVGIRALALMPLPTEKRNQGQAEVAVTLQGVRVRPGEWLYADADGIVVMSKPA